MEKIIVFGGSTGHGKCIVDSIRELNSKTDIAITDIINELDALYAKGYKNIIVDFVEELNERKTIIQKIEEKGFGFQTVVDSSAQVSSTAKIGTGVYIGKGVIVQPEAKIADFVVVDTGSVIDAEAYIGLYSRVKTGGIIGKGALVGELCYVDVKTVVEEKAQLLDGTRTDPVSVYK